MLNKAIFKINITSIYVNTLHYLVLNDIIYIKIATNAFIPKHLFLYTSIITFNDISY